MRAGEIVARDYTQVARDHWQKALKYDSRWRMIWWAWHAKEAAKYARKVVDDGIPDFEQTAEVAAILAEVPAWLGGNTLQASKLLEAALSYDGVNEMVEMFPHTRARMICTLASIHAKEVSLSSACELYYRILRLKDESLLWENDPWVKRQWVNILTETGLFFRSIESSLSVELIRSASDLARSMGQEEFERLKAALRVEGLAI